MSIISKVRDLIVGSPLPAPTNGGEVASRPTGQYMRGGRGVTFAGWKPALREAQDDIADAWDDAAARVGDLLHNNGWLAGAVDQAAANTVGSGLRLKSIPENETFGMTAVEASEWCKTVNVGLSCGRAMRKNAIFRACAPLGRCKVRRFAHG